MERRAEEGVYIYLGRGLEVGGDRSGRDQMGEEMEGESAGELGGFCGTVLEPIVVEASWNL